VEEAVTAAAAATLPVMPDPTLTRLLKAGSYGKDVQAVRRASLKMLKRRPPTAPLKVQRTFGPGMRRLVKDTQRLFEIRQTGVVGPVTYQALRDVGAFDAYADRLLAEHAESVRPKLVEPTQGWASLHASLWKAYSLGRDRGFTDLGTYNPNSTLPSGRPSDHAVYPAFAFDLGIRPATGWGNVKGRAYVLQVCGWREVEYVILGNRIYFGRLNWRRYTGGGHFGHIHVSGRR